MLMVVEASATCARIGVECIRVLGCLGMWKVVEWEGSISRGEQVCLPVPLRLVQPPKGTLLKVKRISDGKYMVSIS